MKITLDEDIVELAVAEYLSAKGFVAHDVNLKKEGGSYGPIVAEVQLDNGKPLDESTPTDDDTSTSEGSQ